MGALASAIIEGECIQLGARDIGGEPCRLRSPQTRRPALPGRCAAGTSRSRPWRSATARGSSCARPSAPRGDWPGVSGDRPRPAWTSRFQARRVHIVGEKAEGQAGTHCHTPRGRRRSCRGYDSLQVIHRHGMRAPRVMLKDDAVWRGMMPADALLAELAAAWSRRALALTVLEVDPPLHQPQKNKKQKTVTAQ